MKRKIAIVTSVGVALGLLGGCGGADNGPPVSSMASGSSGSSGSSAPGPTATQQSLDTQEVLAQAQNALGNQFTLRQSMMDYWCSPTPVRPPRRSPSTRNGHPLSLGAGWLLRCWSALASASRRRQAAPYIPASDAQVLAELPAGARHRAAPPANSLARAWISPCRWRSSTSPARAPPAICASWVTPTPCWRRG